MPQQVESRWLWLLLCWGRRDYSVVDWCLVKGRVLIAQLHGRELSSLGACWTSQSQQTCCLPCNCPYKQMHSVL